MSSHPVVAASGLRVAFPSRCGPVEALKGVDLLLPKGSLFILLGPNGAGKTTLMRCITGLVRPTSGRIRVFESPEAPASGAGLEAAGAGLQAAVTGAASAQAAGDSRAWIADRPDRLRRIGVLIENPGAYGRLDAREYLAFFGSFYGVEDLPGRIEELCGGFGLALDGKRVSKLSQGNRQKLQLVRSLLHDPELLLWDEPTDHLDPDAQAKVLGYLRSYLARAGATALIATHRLEQMEGLGTHFGFLKEGRLILAGTRKEVLGAGTERTRFTFAHPVGAGEIIPLAVEAGLTVHEADGSDAPSGAAIVVSGPDLSRRIPALIKAFSQRDLPILSVEPLKTTLSEQYQTIMSSEI